MSLSATSLSTEKIGYFRIFATPPGGERQEITLFRNAPVLLESFSTSDPFTDTTASIGLPQVTIFDNPGFGDLDWLVPDSDIDIIWQNFGSNDYDWRWEGYIVSYDVSLSGTETSFVVELQGALFALDSYLAKPSFPRRPIPYEILIENAFDQKRYPCNLGKLKITFPEDWEVRVPEYAGPEFYRSTLRPYGVVPGKKWTGLVSRNTGSWEPMLSGFVQSLLTTMFDEGSSQWTVRNRGKRRPELLLRKPLFEGDPQILEVTLGGPGVSFQATKDFSQRANTIYGQGKDEAGITFSGMAVAPSGSTTYFKPYAYSPLVYPRKGNPVLDKTLRPKETMIRFTDGLDELAAQRVAEGQFQRFSEPGFTGTLVLQTDPVDGNGQPFPRMLLKAGATIRIKGLQGIDEGLLVHITQTTANVNEHSISLTFDSKYRDVLTVDEVRARTRDALSPLRSLQLGKFSNTIQDLLYPWNYREGSGIIPSGDTLNATEFFLEKLPARAQFPYEEWTQKFPPKDYPNYYIKIGKTDTENSTKNWSGGPRNGESLLAIPIRMGYAGQIRLTEIAAYDKHGNVMPVRFHVSFYENPGVGPDSMPEFPENPDDLQWLKPAGISVTYGTGQSHPFIKDAWEEITDTGEIPESDATKVRPNAGFVVGWGNYYEPAGYSPGRFSRGASRTGVLSDSAEWTWDLSENFSQTDRDDKPLHEWGGYLFVQIYCDEQGDEPVFFQGRLFRTEPGTT